MCYSKDLYIQSVYFIGADSLIDWNHVTPQLALGNGHNRCKIL